MELSEQELYQDFGLEPPEAEPGAPDGQNGENGQGVAAPASRSARAVASSADGLERGGETEESRRDSVSSPSRREAARREQERRDTTGENDQSVADSETQEPPTGAPEGQEPPPAMSPEERHRQAAMRRAQEEQARRASQQAALDEAYRNAFAGKLNPYTGRPILNQADFIAYQQAQQAEQNKRRMEKLEKVGLDKATLESVVEQLPVVQQAKQALAQAEQAKAAAQAEQARSWFGEQLKGIAALGVDPEIKSLEDLAGKYPEQYPAMMERVRRGATLVEAYQTVNFDAIVTARTAAAKQAAMNAAAGKAHLKPTGPAGGSGGAVEVPDDVRQMYRDMIPGISDADIRKEYAEFLKVSKA